MTALTDAVPENPIPAALIGMGVLWLFTGGSNTSLFGGDGRTSLFRKAARATGQVTDVLEETAGRAASSLGRTAQAAAETTSDLAGGIRSAFHAVSETAAETADQAKAGITSASDATAHATSRAAETVGSAASSAAHTAQVTARSWNGGVQEHLAEWFDRQPLLLGAVGMAVGAGIAASIPTSETEKHVMGEASKRVQEAVEDKATEVKKMAGAAFDEAKAQGLAPKVAGDTLRGVTDRVTGITRPAGPNPSAEAGGQQITRTPGWASNKS